MTKVLTPEQIANYRNAGYIEPISIFSAAEVAAMRTQ
jgi:hypothetical protein